MDIARKIGNPKAVRAVGQALGRNPIPIVIPCHRVIASNGSLGGYSGGGGLETKAKLLQLEGALGL
jgi:methylated-DNA-[protein]-cysteine S-methyltransferase